MKESSRSDESFAPKLSTILNGSRYAVSCGDEVTTLKISTGRQR